MRRATLVLVTLVGGGTLLLFPHHARKSAARRGLGPESSADESTRTDALGSTTLIPPSSPGDGGPGRASRRSIPGAEDAPPPSRARIRVLLGDRVRTDALLVLQWSENDFRRTREVEWTSEDEWIDLPGKGAVVVAHAGVPEPRPKGPIVSIARSEPLLVTGMHEGDEPIEVHLRTGVSLAIQLVGEAPDLEELWAQTVPFERFSPSSAEVAFAPGAARSAGRYEATIVGGALRFLDMEPDTYAVAVGRRGEGPVAFVRKRVMKGIDAVSVAWPGRANDHGCTVRCVSPGPDGPPMDLQVDVEFPRGVQSASAALLRDGRHWIDLSARGRRERVGDPRRLFLRCPRWGTVVVDLVADRRDYVARFDHPSSLTVRVAGGSRPGWSVRACRADAPPGARGPAVYFVDDLSRHALQPGAYRLELVRQESERREAPGAGFPHMSGVLATLDVDVVRGGQEFVFPEPRLHDLVVHVPGREAHEVLLSSRGPLGHLGNAFTDDDGVVRFEDLPAGTYTVLPLGMGWMTVDVPCERVAFVPDEDR
ncbi:MAG: hypothetical protein AAGB93_02105 [Planctomycetota bacterium]